MLAAVRPSRRCDDNFDGGLELSSEVSCPPARLPSLQPGARWEPFQSWAVTWHRPPLGMEHVRYSPESPLELRRVGRTPEIKRPSEAFLLILMHTPPSSHHVAQSQLPGSRLPSGADTHFSSRRALWLKQPLNYLRGKRNPHYKFQPITCQSIQSRTKYSSRIMK